MSSFTDGGGPPTVSVRLRKSNDTVWLILQGEADMATYEALGAALENVELDGVRSIHLHVKQLGVVDLITVRQLTVFAKQAKQAGRDVKTCGASLSFRMLARMLGVRDDLGLL